MGISQNQAVTRNFHLINGSGESLLDLEPVAVEPISAFAVADLDRTIFGKFPNYGVCITGHAPLADDAVRISTAIKCAERNGESDRHRGGLL